MSSTVAGVLSALRTPVSDEMREVLARRWAELPAELQVPHQVVGSFYAHCGYTLGPAACSFGCTHCYLPTNANAAPLPTLAEMVEQIDANRRLLGPGGALQITGGDVVDAYLEADREDELVGVVRHAVDAGLVPMLMTHGQKLLERPAVLERLVVEGGLRKLAIHVDATQAGRPGYPLAAIRSETDLHPLRERFVDLIHDTRRATGVAFAAAHTVTVVERNLDSIAEILRWLLASPRRLSAFRMVSFQPEAAVGRTRSSRRPVSPETTWAAIEAGVGTTLPREAMLYGHSKCSSMVSLLTIARGEGTQAVAIFGEDEQSRAWQAEILRLFGGVGGRGEASAEAWARKIGVVARHPGFLLRSAAQLRRRLAAAGVSLASALVDGMRGRIGALNIVMHSFMDQAEVAAGGPEVAARLAACSFRGAVEVDGAWKAVPMCEMNAVHREELYAEQIVSIGSRRRGSAGPLSRGADVAN